ncbi:16S rRNA (uracil(1498)-N(3))-methyltransferase [Candidatus Dependentiae bacterium]|nr:16S rRNA (uracil(1498)-N(3))-methyltransferase [Candidatus Dependentiae bacterium]
MAHEFACFFAQLPVRSTIGTTIELCDEQLIHRLHNVLRVQADESLTLFNHHTVVHCIVRQMRKRQIQVEILQANPIVALQPELTLLLGVLKKDALQEAVYAATELGVTTIRLLQTNQVHRQFMGPIELRKLQLTAIAAAEQSKNFFIPTIIPPMTLQQLVQETAHVSAKILCDITGTSIIKHLASLQDHQARHIAIAIGPEGDFIQQERQTLLAAGFVPCRLTTTVLRSTQAVAVACGIIRSL